MDDRYCLVFTYCVSVCLSSDAGRNLVLCCLFFFQAEDGIRDLVRSRGLGDVYKRQAFASEGGSSDPYASLAAGLGIAIAAFGGSLGQGLSLIHI